jgi:hypothetical protein
VVRKNYYADLVEHRIILFFIIIFILLWFVSKSTYYSSGWDDIMHWGRFTKFIYFTHSLPDQSSLNIVHLGYPLGSAIFHSFILKYLSGFSEGGTFFAQNILLISPLFIVLDQKKSNIINLNIFLLFLIVIYTIIFTLHITDIYRVFSTLYNDILIGVYFAATILMYLNNRQNYLINWLLLPILSFLVLVKDTALLFALIAAAFIIVDQLILFKEQLIDQPKKKIILGLSIFMLLTGMLLVKISWIYYCQDFIKSQINYLNFLNNPHFHAIAANFFSSLLFINHSIRPYFTTSLWLYILLGLSFYVIKTAHHNERSLFIRLFTTLLVGYFIYALLLFVLYLTWFSEYEASFLASFNRYIGTYILAYALILTPLIFFHYQKIINSKVILIILIIITSVMLTREFSPFGRQHYLSPERQKAKQIAKQILSLPISPNKNAKIYVIEQNSWAWASYILGYELLLDYNLTTHFYSIGKPYSAKDISTHLLTPNEFKQILSSYDYILLIKTDKQFWSLYGSVFRPNKPSLAPTFYKIIKQNGKDIKLEKVF